jgi:hypothetical protein
VKCWWDPAPIDKLFLMVTLKCWIINVASLTWWSFLRYLCTRGHIVLLDNIHQYSLRPFGGIAGSEALSAPPVWWEPGST